MISAWTFGTKLAAGLAVTVACTTLVSGVSIYALRTVVSSLTDVVALNGENLIDASGMEAVSVAMAASNREYLLLGRYDIYTTQTQKLRHDFAELITRIRPRLRTAEDKAIVVQLDEMTARLTSAVDRTAERRKGDTTADAALKIFEAEVLAARVELDRTLGEFRLVERKLLDEHKQAAATLADYAVGLTLLLAVLTVGLSAGTAVYLIRTLTRQIGGAITNLGRSASELQSSATQQASGTRELASSMTQITTTIRDVLLTSQQIARGAQRFAVIAEETASGAQAGDKVVQAAQVALSDIRQQVDLIVTQMLELGRKSKQVEEILDVIAETSDQTNILAINATIEAVGAGEQGKRFAALAGEIRKLADRVGASTRAIRSLVDDMRSSVYSTVMTTEGGAKAVIAGTVRFVEVTDKFHKIVALVEGSLEAAREIELSTRQQAAAAGQVEVGVASVNMATREAEAGTYLTLKTVTELTRLSGDLASLIRQPTLS